ncbi:hypothetical protein LCGC14_0885410 [marine sediment metagenome]|uniref:Uncharacterized protein n=1 Tax=marine sediment metagenome TaxID=412755 RepID=A0A0F9RKA4_9ZZZZ
MDTSDDPGTISFLVSASSIAAATVATVRAVEGGGRGGGGGGGVPARRAETQGPVARSTADVESGERQRASVFKRLSRLRRATLVSERSAAEPQILNTKLSGT